MAGISPDELKYMEEHASDSKVGNIIASVISCGCIAYFAVGLRFYARNMVKFGVGLDDLAILAALIVFTGFFIGFALGTQWGLGKHAIRVTNGESLAKSNISDEVTYTVAIAFVKYSILLLYSRIFPSKGLRIAIITTAVFITAWACSSIFGSIFQCVPIRSQWDPSVQGKCINYGNFVLAIGIINIISDFVILVLPIPVIWSLNMKKTKKLLTIFTLVAGSFACVVSIVRLAYAQSVGSTVDASWDDVGGGILSCVEICIGILAACVPTYRPILNRFTRSRDYGSHSRTGGIVQTTDIHMHSVSRSAFKEDTDNIAYVNSGPKSFGVKLSDTSSDKERLYTMLPE
ncbi:hypothetical protein BGW36DRAFT_463777 [Talaromyces proteolyticus]|uniref:Rhodopsin domain-containing protein n=1 Tax=Talaromyces proteolyticus TaxID=1131652 RepID=A0AAD4KR46_9EURO|nr:uncharacterized protein BGW36DRAFT_463777 [Talaromyces proteolyticus]KAH8694199.1 hypothetical protein BGW36DRAFT_463777 [Talaromyces proteolyticus]